MRRRSARAGPIVLALSLAPALLTASLSWSTRAAAQPREADTALAEGRRRYADLDFDGAVEALRRALATPGLADAERLEALEYLGCAYLVLERSDSARTAFEEMLRLDPYRVLREATGSPRIRNFVRRLRARLVPDAALDERVIVRVRAPRRLRVGQRARVVAEIDGPRSVGGATLWSRSGDGEYRRATMREAREGRRFEADLAAPRTADDVELYVVARDEEGRVVARGAEPAAPARVEVIPDVGPARVEPGPSVFSRWWFWTAVAAAAASGVVLGAVLGSGESAPAGTLSPGRVEIP